MNDSNGNALQHGHVYAGFVYDEDGLLQDTGVFVCFAGDDHLYDIETDAGTLDEHFDVLVEQSGAYIREYDLMSPFYQDAQVKGFDIDSDAV